MDSKDFSRRGQSMLIAILALGGAMLAATTIAGLLILYQLRATTNSVNSSESIFAADTGVQWALYDYYCTLDGGKPSCPPTSVTSSPLSSNGARIAITCYDTSNNPTACNNTSTMSYAVSKGTSLNTSRAFYLLITAATSTFP